MERRRALLRVSLWISCLLLCAAQRAHADACFDSIQNKIAWDGQGKATTWMPNNIQRLCAGAEDSKGPGQCFRALMSRRAEGWTWQDAIALCAGVRNPGPTLGCYDRLTRSGGDRRAAIAGCQSGASSAKAPAPAPAANSPSERYIPEEWEQALPWNPLEVEEAGVTQSFERTPDAFARRWAAREVIAQYIEVMAGVPRGRLPPKSLGSDRMNAYTSNTSPVAERTPAVLQQAARYAADAAFHEQVITKVVPSPHREAYFSSDAWQALVKKDRIASPAAMQTKKELDVAKRPDVDRKVFGIELGEVPSHPPCAAGQFTPGGQTCALTEGGLVSMIYKVTATGETNETPGTQRVVVMLAQSRCPEWVDSCAVALTLKDEYAVAASFRTSRRASDAFVEQQLTDKYGVVKVTGHEDYVCTSHDRSAYTEYVYVERTPIKIDYRRWEKPGLTVYYAQACMGGVVDVYTDVYRRLLGQAQSSQPKM
jgi:hypothetical protein